MITDGRRPPNDSERHLYQNDSTTLTKGKRFEEHGAWSFVLEQDNNAWRIAGYGWGVTAYSETPR